jgi:engulfment/cell motility protein 1
MDSTQSSKLETIQPDVIALIAKQRLLRLSEGGRFLKYSAKGQRIKDRYWLCKLSPNHRTLHYGDLDDNKDKTIDELPNRVNVSDIKRILVGRDCPHTKEGHMKKTSVDLALTLVYESDHEENLNFVASDHKTFCYWIDGLNALIKAQMPSDEFQRDLQILSKIELKMRTISIKSY